MSVSNPRLWCEPPEADVHAASNVGRVFPVGTPQGPATLIEFCPTLMHHSTAPARGWRARRAFRCLEFL
jgi:hypothetical protein